MAGHYDILEPAEAEARFSVSDHVDYPYQDYGDEQEIRQYLGGLRLNGDFTAETDEDDFCYTNVIVDGDLVADGNLEWSDEGYGSFLLVTGDLRVRNLILRGNPTVVVRGNLAVEGTVLGRLGDDGGYLAVLGETEARTIVLLDDFRLRAATRPQATLAGMPGLFSLPVDITDQSMEVDGKGTLSDLLLPELIDEERGEVPPRCGVG
ncbi:hypothetical protein [Streptomyces sp. TE33382]